jgi:hypothetical protein
MDTPTPEQLRELLACPDCDSTVELHELTPGIISAGIAHDPTCPTYQQIERERRAG